ncbi:hypothetical protein ACIQOU_08945 [Streptomyces sp. NPDC091279]|uniref:hypothetical protein n=1 Tax=unclassified Streptomyces TaxID=2593676 RepID=UPI003824364D
MRFSPPKSTLRKAALGTLALGMLGVGVGVVTAAPAEAVSGRRLCVYTENESGWTQLTDNRRYSAYVAVNYKKDGACPTVNPSKFRWKVGAQPVRKITCEQWPAVANPWPGTDVCTQIPADAVFEARVYEDGRGPAGWSIGASVWQFQ